MGSRIGRKDIWAREGFWFVLVIALSVRQADLGLIVCRSAVAIDRKDTMLTVFDVLGAIEQINSCAC